MSVTIAVYNASYSQITERVGSFNNAQEAAHYRDHSSLAHQPTKLEQLGRNDNYTPVDDAGSSVDDSNIYSHAEDNGWTHTSEGWLID